MITWAAFLLVQLADIITTRIGLSGGATEGNPVIAWFMDRFGRNGWIVTKLTIASMAALALWARGSPEWIWVITGGTAFFVLRNIRVIRGQK